MEEGKIQQRSQPESAKEYLLTPSPVMATRWPRPWRLATTKCLCSGKTSANPSARSMNSLTSLPLMLLSRTETKSNVQHNRQGSLTDAMNAPSDKLLRVKDVRSQMKLLGELLSDGDCVSREHLDADPEFLSLSDGLCRVGPRRVAHRHDAEQLPVFAVLLDGDTETTEPSSGELGGFGLVCLGLGRVEGLEFEDAIEEGGKRSAQGLLCTYLMEF